MKSISTLIRGLVTAGLLVACAPAPGIQPFESDGCSLFPDGTWDDRNLWCECCFQHDVAYWRGGTAEDRKKADEALKECVREKTGNAQLAELMYHGVRLGGAAIFPSWYRWGYGWPYGRGDRVLTARERQLADDALRAYRLEDRAYQCGD